MNAKEIEVLCPCCATRLLVDVRTGTILRRTTAAAQEPAPGEDRWDSASKKVRDRTLSGAEKLESALEDERTKESRFDELFRKATDKHARKPEE